MYALLVTLFLSKRKHLNVFVKGYYTTVDFCHNLDPRQIVCINFQLHNLYGCIESLKIAGLSFSKLSFKVASVSFNYNYFNIMHNYMVGFGSCG